MWNVGIVPFTCSPNLSSSLQSKVYSLHNEQSTVVLELGIHYPVYNAV